jgi:uncharacterized metal-binding protein YceD (DUF177 family)
MTGDAPELSRPLRLDTLGAEPRAVEIEADESERAALARRFGLVGIDRLAARADVVRRGEEVVARGRLSAEVVQSCVASGEPVPASVDEPFDLLFRPSPAARPDEEVELSEAELDIVFYDGAAVDLGEAVAESLALALDPYPRAPGADAALKAAGVKSEEEAGPFGALAGLRDKLKK